jgi:hypothetical protein
MRAGPGELAACGITIGIVEIYNQGNHLKHIIEEFFTFARFITVF